MMGRAAGMFGIVLVAWHVSPAMTQPLGDVAVGADIARTWCSNCHVIGRNATGSPSDAAPPFVTVARKPQTTSLSLRVFLQTSHSNMPNYQLTQAEMDDVIAYVLSLKEGG